jgi:CxxC-x17-CxxC domain-containing protein
MTPSKTPQFDALLDPILESYVPHKRTCRWKGKHMHCESDFDILNEDIAFLVMLRVPAPNYCPTCRRIRRVIFMGSNRFFKRPCNAPGHTETVISVLPAECPFPVYDYIYFIGDEFDPFSFGSEWEEGTSPMGTLLSLREIFPMPSFLNRDSLSLNSDYSNGGRNLKNGYFAFGCFDSENVLYSNLILKSKDVMDSRAIRHSEFVYNSLASDYVYKSSYVYFSTHIVDSMFMFDCRNCDYCFGCVNLRNKKYCVYNEQLTKEDYEIFIKNIHPISINKIKEYEQKFWQLVKSLPMNASHNLGSENVSGVGITNSKDIYDCVDADKSEHIRYADGAMSHKDSMGILFSGGHSHNLYGTINVGSEASNVKFSVSSKYCTDCEFVFNSKNLSNCFMCFGLQNKSYCILNKQYKEKDYFNIVDKMKTEMLKRGEYEDGLGFSFSAQPYNFSSGYTTYPLTDEEIKELGGYLGNEPDTNAGDIATIEPKDLPQTIEDTSDDVLNKAILCEKTNRPFRIVPAELAFYRNMGLPLPSIHPTPRMRVFADQKPTSKKYQAICAKCSKEIQSMFDPSEEYFLYCEKCYQSEVI